MKSGSTRRVNGFAIVSKDADYNSLSVVRGSPPKVIWLLLGNCTTAQGARRCFAHRFADVEAFGGKIFTPWERWH